MHGEERMVSGFLPPQELSGESIWLGISGTGAKRQGEVKTNQDQGPLSWTRVQLLGRADVCQVPVVRPHKKWLLNPSSPCCHSSNANFTMFSSHLPMM